MFVSCENCEASFNLDEKLVKSTGSKVRCSKCKHIFVVYPPEPPPQDIDPDTDIVEESQAPPPEASLDEQIEDDLDLSNIEKMLDNAGQSIDEATSPTIDTPAPEEPEGEAIDLSAIEKMLDEEDTADDSTDEIPEDQELEFDLDVETELEAESQLMDTEPELDLGDLEKMFEPEAEQAPDDAAEEEALSSLEAAAFETEDDAFALDTEEQKELEAFDLSDSPEFEIEIDEDEPDLSMALETEAGEDTDETEAASEIDLSEIQLALDTDEPEADEPELTQEPELSLDESEPDEEPELSFESDDAQDDDDAMAVEMSENLEPEDESVPSIALEAEEDDTIAEDQSESELDLDGLELQLDDEKTTESDISLSGLEMGITSENDPVAQDAEAEPAEASDIELEMDTDDTPEPTEEETSETIETPVTLDEDEDEFRFTDDGDDSVPIIPDEEEVLAEQAVAEPEDEPVVSEEPDESKPGEKPGIFRTVSTVLLGLLIVVILASGILMFLKHKGIQVPFIDSLQIPFLGNMSKQPVQDPGNLKITTLDVQSRFIENKSAGRLFIISGKAKNAYNKPRSYIRVTGKLYTKGKFLAKTENVYCGNVLPDLEISSLGISEIKRRLTNRTGDQNANIGIKTGDAVPFMLVFWQLPDDMEEFTIEIASSSPVAP